MACRHARIENEGLISSIPLSNFNTQQPDCHKTQPWGYSHSNPPSYTPRAPRPTHPHARVYINTRTNTDGHGGKYSAVSQRTRRGLHTHHRLRHRMHLWHDHTHARRVRHPHRTDGARGVASAARMPDEITHDPTRIPWRRQALTSK